MLFGSLDPNRSIFSLGCLICFWFFFLVVVVVFFSISLYNIEWEALVHDPTLPRTGNLQCDRCPNKEVVLLQTGFGLSSTGSGTSGGMNLWFVCTNCFYRWSNTNK